ncbi:SLC13 family permease [Caldimonas manganoxidans]|uniref:SLC13 family permease n=2 Tax=Caldimonas TaxID=196013 RepID=UPI000374FFF4|nr:SLC13 family permease [Caldimonas manganoxidans]
MDLLSLLAIHGLSGHGVVICLFTLAVFVVFVLDRLPVASVCLGILVFLPVFFTLFPMPLSGSETLDVSRFYAGFGHPALVAICSLMVIGHALVVTGALEPAARRLSGLVVQRPFLALAVVLLAAAGASGFVNDTPVVVLLLPLLIAAAHRAKTSAAGMLMPMNYAVLIGGMATTIGTSTNLIVVNLAQQLGLPAIGMLDFYPIVATAAVPALLYLWLVAPRLLASVKGNEAIETQEAFDAEIYVEPGSWLEGKRLGEVIETTEGRMRVLEVRDERGRSRVKLPTSKLRAGDRLVLQDTVANLKEFETVLKASLHGLEDDEEERSNENASASPDEQKDTKTRRRASAIVAQMVITAQSPLVGRTVRQMRLGDRYQIAVLGVRPGRTPQANWSRKELADRQLYAGDVLLLQGPIQEMQEAQRDGFGLLLDSRHVLPRQDKAWIALLTLGATVALAVTKILPIEVAAMGGVIVLLAAGALSWRDIGASLSMKVVMLVAASLALGDALMATGGTEFLASQLVTMANVLEPRWVLVGLMGLMGLLTNFVSNNAAAAIGTPLGFEMARQLGVPPEPYVLAVLFGCNLCYLTPMGYQTNLLVMNAGGYRFGDFVRVGAPLFLIMWLGLSAALVWRYGL